MGVIFAPNLLKAKNMFEELKFDKFAQQANEENPEDELSSSDIMDKIKYDFTLPSEKIRLSKEKKKQRDLWEDIGF